MVGSSTEIEDFPQQCERYASLLEQAVIDNPGPIYSEVGDDMYCVGPGKTLRLFINTLTQPSQQESFMLAFASKTKHDEKLKEELQLYNSPLWPQQWLNPQLWNLSSGTWFDPEKWDRFSDAMRWFVTGSGSETHISSGIDLNRAEHHRAVRLRKDVFAQTVHFEAPHYRASEAADSRALEPAESRAFRVRVLRDGLSQVFGEEKTKDFLPDWGSGMTGPSHQSAVKTLGKGLEDFAQYPEGEPSWRVITFALDLTVHSRLEGRLVSGNDVFRTIEESRRPEL